MNISEICDTVFYKFTASSLQMFVLRFWSTSSPLNLFFLYSTFCVNLDNYLISIQMEPPRDVSASMARYGPLREIGEGSYRLVIPQFSRLSVFSMITIRICTWWGYRCANSYIMDLERRWFLYFSTVYAGLDKEKELLPVAIKACLKRQIVKEKKVRESFRIYYRSLERLWRGWWENLFNNLPGYIWWYLDYRVIL